MDALSIESRIRKLLEDFLKSTSESYVDAFRFSIAGNRFRLTLELEVVGNSWIDLYSKILNEIPNDKTGGISVNRFDGERIRVGIREDYCLTPDEN